MEGTIEPEDTEPLRELMPGAQLSGSYALDRTDVDSFGDENSAVYPHNSRGLSLGMLVGGIYLVSSYEAITEVPTQITLENDRTSTGVPEDRYEVMVSAMVGILSEWSWSGSFVLTLTSTSDLSAIQDTALSVYPPELERFDGRELRLSLYNHLTGTSITVHATVTSLGLYT